MHAVYSIHLNIPKNFIPTHPGYSPTSDPASSPLNFCCTIPTSKATWNQWLWHTSILLYHTGKASYATKTSYILSHPRGIFRTSSRSFPNKQLQSDLGGNEISVNGGRYFADCLYPIISICTVELEKVRSGHSVESVHRNDLSSWICACAA